MPRLTRYAIRLGLVHLALGMGGWLLYTLNQIGTVGGNWAALRPISLHWITVGWLTQLIFAVMYWMFPIISRAAPYGERWIAWLGFGALNIGLAWRAVFEFGLSQGWGSQAGWGLVGAGVLQWAGVTAWIIAVWPRIRERGGR